jgi:hypothetical protein
MNLLSFNLADISSALAIIGKFIVDNPILCGALFITYIVHYLYSFIFNHAVDTDVYEIDLITAGMSSFMVSLLLLGLDESQKSFNLSEIDFTTATTKVAIFLAIFAFILVILAFIKVLPKFMVVLLGNSEVDLFINLSAVMMTDPEIELTGTILAVIAVPLIILLIILRIRRIMK